MASPCQPAIVTVVSTTGEIAEIDREPANCDNTSEQTVNYVIFHSLSDLYDHEKGRNSLTGGPGSSDCFNTASSTMEYRPLFILAILFSSSLCAQDNYEIQVYGSETVKPGQTMVELHNNFTVSGSKDEVNGVYATQHAWHETAEITHGFTPWFETGFYIFTSASTRYGWQWVGDHIRPRVRVPDDWHWPFGASLSLEVGYQRPQYSQDTWTLEIRPIIDKQINRWYLSFNPTMDRSFHGPSVSQGITFSPNFKAGFDVTKRINAGLEYYGSLGPVTGFSPFRDQQQQIVPAIDLNLGPNWEFNFGVGIGVTQSTDHLIVKMILGRRFGGTTRKAKAEEQGQEAPMKPPSR